MLRILVIDFFFRETIGVIDKQTVTAARFQIIKYLLPTGEESRSGIFTITVAKEWPPCGCAVHA